MFKTSFLSSLITIERSAFYTTVYPINSTNPKGVFLTLKKFVAPGELVASMEEMESVKGSYERDDAFYAARSGMVEIDPQTREARVGSTKGPKTITIIGKGSTVYGQVRMVMPNIAVVDVWAEPTKERRPFTAFSSAIILVGSASPQYLKEMKEAVRIGDIVKAKVFDQDVGGYKLTTKEEGLGVIWAACTKCRSPLALSKDRKLKCTECGKIEQRKVSFSDYVIKE